MGDRQDIASTDAQDADTVGVGTPPSDELSGADPKLGEANVTGDSATQTASIGRYVPLAEVGRGGMGRVVRAYDPKLQREVALKELRRDRTGSEATARLISEARAMARLSHPNVVAVYDVENIEGKVVLVMEFVDGSNLSQWLREEKRPWQETLRVVIAAARGLAAAHREGLLHRDFKPANVLLGQDGAIKVTDFGLAKDANGNNISTMTEPGFESVDGAASLTMTGTVVGTPRYMAPEQHHGLELSVATDQYALCVSLWEALCGKPPFGGKDMDSKKRGGPPVWPTTSVPGRVVSAIRRGLAPDPDDRWPSIDALLTELTTETGIRRQRNLALTTGTALAATLVVAAYNAEESQVCTGATQRLGAAWNAARRDEIQTAMLAADVSYAGAAWTRTADTLDAFTQEWIEQHTDACEATNVRREVSAEVLDLRMSCLDRARIQLEAATGVLAAADSGVVERAHEILQGLGDLSGCDDLDALRAGVAPPRAEDAEAVLFARQRLAQGNAQRAGGHYSIAEAELIAAAEALEPTEYGPLKTEVANIQALVLYKVRRLDEADAHAREGMRLATQNAQWDELRFSARALSWIAGDRGHLERGLRYMDLALSGAEEATRSDADARRSLAALQLRAGDFDEALKSAEAALEAYEHVLPEGDPGIARAYSTLGSVYAGRAEWDLAIEAHKTATGIATSAFGENHPTTIEYASEAALVPLYRGDYAVAEAELRSVLAQLEASGNYDPNEVIFGGLLMNLAGAMTAQGKVGKEVIEMFERALVIFEAAEGPKSLTVGGLRGNLGALFLQQEKYAEAEEQLRRCLEIILEISGDESLNSATVHANLGTAYAQSEKYEQAEAEHKKALTVYEEKLPPEHPRTAAHRSSFADVLRELGKFDEAQRLSVDAWERLAKTGSPQQAASAAFVAAKVLDRRDSGRALELAREARKRYLAAGDGFAKDAKDVGTWINARTR